MTPLPMAAISAVVLSVSMSLSLNPAKAEWPHNAFSCRAYKADLVWHRWARRHCPSYRWRKAWRPRHVASDTGAHCHIVVAATGAQAQSVAKAQERALIAWMGDVSYRFGSRYMDIGHAKGRLIDCSISDVGDTLGSKIQDALGVGHYRCRLTAAPCRAEARKWKDN
jgi:hypothetical protein